MAAGRQRRKLRQRAYRPPWWEAEVNAASAAGGTPSAASHPSDPTELILSLRAAKAAEDAAAAGQDIEAAVAAATAEPLPSGLRSARTEPRRPGDRADRTRARATSPGMAAFFGSSYRAVRR